MRTATIAMALAALLITPGAALAAEKGPLSGSNAGTPPHGLPATPSLKPDLRPVISTAGPVPLFGVMNGGPVAAGASVMSIGCVPVNFAATGHCKLNMSNDPMVDPGANKINVPALAKGETKWFGLQNVPGAAPAQSWFAGAYKFWLSVDSTQQVAEKDENNNSSQIHIWNKP